MYVCDVVGFGERMWWKERGREGESRGEEEKEREGWERGREERDGWERKKVGKCY